jgi:hypothetical protein
MVQFSVWFFFSTCFLSDISTSVGFLYPSDSLRRIVLWEQWKKLSHMRIKFKSWNVWTLDHSTYLCHRCRIIRKPESYKTYDRTVAITTLNLKVNDYLAIHLSTKMNETTIHNTVIKCSVINLMCKSRWKCAIFYWTEHSLSYVL